MSILGRRRALLGAKTEPPDTAAVIDVTGARWSRNYDVTSGGMTYDVTAGITKFYPISPSLSAQSLITGTTGFTGSAANNVYKSKNYDGTNGWETWNSKKMYASWKEVSFTVGLANIDDAYAYVNSTGQVLFAGKNTPYYGKKNINE